MSMTIEWAPFTLADGVDEASLLRASEAVQADFISQQRGFVRRDLLKGEHGQWIDLLYWDSHEAAQQAMQNAANSPVCLEYFQLLASMDDSDPAKGVLHFAVVRQYGAAVPNAA